ncbi:MAG: phenylalanine--tRNA ligase subunit beta [Candidatus Levybacteria bacterium]|nr:phenylalanine--tRNA ligase subunit beta [Candidatus Levybacteria bacterium]
MLAPLSWLKEYVDIALKPEELGARLTEVGLGTEKITKVDGDTIFEFEVTPNRPDWLSIIGIAREIAVIESKAIKYPKLKTTFRGSTPKGVQPLTIKTDFEINPRFTAIIIDGITVKNSPKWLKERLIKIGQRPINNIVDITNYVMFELGNPLHAFDYHKIKGNIMTVHQTKGGESFKSVDGTTYRLPKDAVVISDEKKIIDLCGIKGGFNSGTFEETKTIVIRVPVENPGLIRRASQSLGLRSEASSIFERGVNAGGTVEALARCVDLILEFAGGKTASNLYDFKKTDFKPWRLKLSLERLNKILGIEIKEIKVLQILKNLNLSPKKLSKDIIEAIIPTYRNDLKIEEDLIEEVARLYGYNNFPKSIPIGELPTQQIPYYKDYKIEEKAKQILVASEFSEIYSYSLVSETDLLSSGVDPQKTLRVDNPVSREFEYLRPTLKINLLKALRQNKPNSLELNFFELGKVYLGKTLDNASEEYMLSAVSKAKNFFELKGILERLFQELGNSEDPTPYLEVLDEGIFFELNFSQFFKKAKPQKTFSPIPKYPPVIEDLAIVADSNVKTGELIKEIKKQSLLIAAVSLLDQFENTRTFHIVYQHKERNLTTEEVAKIREKILSILKEKFNAKLKE